MIKSNQCKWQLRTFELTVNKEFEKVSQWQDANKLMLNAKSPIMSFFVRAKKEYLSFLKLSFLIQL